MIEPEALSPEQLATLQNSMSNRFRHEPVKTPARTPSPQAPSFTSTPHRSNQAPRAQQALPGVLDCDYYPGSYLDVVG